MTPTSLATAVVPRTAAVVPRTGKIIKNGQSSEIVFQMLEFM